MMLGQVGIYMQMNEVGPLPHTTYKSQLKIDHRPKYKCQCYTIKPLDENIVLTFMNLNQALVF